MLLNVSLGNLLSNRKKEYTNSFNGFRPLMMSSHFKIMKASLSKLLASLGTRILIQAVWIRVAIFKYYSILTFLNLIFLLLKAKTKPKRAETIQKAKPTFSAGIYKNLIYFIWQKKKKLNLKIIYAPI